MISLLNLSFTVLPLRCIHFACIQIQQSVFRRTISVMCLSREALHCEDPTKDNHKQGILSQFDESLLLILQND